MKRLFSIVFVLLFVAVFNIFAQIPANTLVNIVKAEDKRRWDSTLEKLLNSPQIAVRVRTALAIGRIGDEKAIPALVNHLNDSPEVTAMVLFALGEIESAMASTEILRFLKDTKQSYEIRTRAAEAAGKIAAANPKDANSVELGKEILNNLKAEAEQPKSDSKLVLALLTAVLRARPAKAEITTAKFLDFADVRVRADALNTMARLRAKNANAKVREMLASEMDAVVRANAARLLGVAEDKEATDLLLKAAAADEDSRVRVSAIRALAGLKDPEIAEKLIPKATVTAENWSRVRNCETEKNQQIICNEFKSEYLEIATVLGRLLPNTNNQKALNFLETFRQIDRFKSPETEIALVRIAPQKYIEDLSKPPSEDDIEIMQKVWQIPSSLAQGLGELAAIGDDKSKAEAERILRLLLSRYETHINARSDILTAFAKFKTQDLAQFLRNELKHKDPIVRTTAAGLLADQPNSKKNFEQLKLSFNNALLADKHDNDAQLAILDALFKLDKKESIGTLLTALNAADYLVRKKAFQLLKTEDLEKDHPGLPTILENFVNQKKNHVLRYSPASGTKLGQVLNTNADYVRAVSRKNGKVKAVFTTTKGTFTINLTPEDAPLTVDNFIKLANSKYFNGVSVHRVVPNFVMQDGDPRGDGNGGPGWSIRCEINNLTYERGAVGMALSGKDTGGSQWFVTHAPQPHLDGGYTVFGKVSENDMKVVDAIVRGDRILTVRIVGETSPKRVKR